MKKEAQRKVTVLLPKDLIKQATEASGEGLTLTLKRGLVAVAAAAAYDKVRSYRGKVRVDLDLERLRQDRD